MRDQELKKNRVILRSTQSWEFMSHFLLKAFPSFLTHFDAVHFTPRESDRQRGAISCPRSHFATGCAKKMASPSLGATATPATGNTVDPPSSTVFN